MTRYCCFLILCCVGVQCWAQSSISGEIGIDFQKEKEVKIHLSRIKLEDFPSAKAEKSIATTILDNEGRFSFRELQLEKKDALYHIYVNTVAEALGAPKNPDRFFVFSARDSIHFTKGKKAFEKYTNTNTADAEWQRLRAYEARLFGTVLSGEDSLSPERLAHLRRYTKDSLQILMVKLIGIKQLDQRELLDVDIAKNPEYYLALLEELKESELERSDYLFLENKLAFLTTEKAEHKFMYSTYINIFLGLIILCLTLYGIRKKRRPKPDIEQLSHQERTIQQLILQGKSNKEIAAELFISISTVKTHITHIYGKLRVANRKELFQKAPYR